MSAPSVKTTCPYCGVGCGVIVTPKPDGLATIAGDADHPANFGRLCSKGSALGETLSLDNRQLTPLVEGERADWNTALDLVASRFAETIAAHGPDSVAFYVSGQILIEDYYVANKLMKGFIGSANIDTNSRLCMASSVAGHRRAFGSDTVPGLYDDLEEADCVVLVGSNLAWCHPVLFQRLLAAREKRGTKLVVVDPRATATSQACDLHLPLAPGSDVALFAGLLAYLERAGAVDRAYVDAHTNGFDTALAEAQALDPGRVASLCGLPRSKILTFFELFAKTPRVVTLYSQGVNQSSAGTDKVSAILNCHLATGRIGKPGMGPFSVTGQPNAMGGREVGGLANMLAAHLEIENADHRRLVQDFWRAPAIPQRAGLKAVDLFRAVADGRVKALWIMGTNPVDSMPEANAVRAALRACPFVVVSEVVAANDTIPLAHVVLPSLAWGEKEGTVTNSERRISRQRAFLAPPGEAMADWRQLTQVARRMGFGEAFAYATAAEIFREYARLTETDNAGRRDLDLGGVADISDQDYEALAPFPWPFARGEAPRVKRFFAEGRFYHPDGRARIVATPYRAPASEVNAQFPLILNTGRIRDQWHTMTRTGKAARLMSQMGEPFVEMHPADADAAGLAAADLGVIESASGRTTLRVVVSERQRRGSVFAPMHWNDQFASEGRVGALVGGAVDPVSGQPEFKFTPVRVRRFAPGWYAFAISTRRIVTLGVNYFALAPAKAGWRAELAGLTAPGDWAAFACDVVGGGPACEWLAYRDAASGQQRFAAFEDDCFVGAFFAAREPVAAARDFLADRLGNSFAPAERLALLAGRPIGAAKDRGPMVCACFEIGRNEILEAARAGCASVAAIGARLGAGTNCGSCRTEIARLVEPAVAASIAI